jgi:tetratricopeptide (TPR) repeat protein
MVIKSWCILLFFFCIPVLGTDCTVYNRQGVDAFKAGHYKNAAEYFSEALTCSPDNAQIKKNYIAACRTFSSECQKKNEWSVLIEILRKANSLIPENDDIRNDLVFAYINFGAAALRARNITEARQSASEAVRLKPEDVSVNCLAGDVAYEENDLESAEKFWRQAKFSSPNNKTVDKRIAKLQSRKKN